MVEKCWAILTGEYPPKTGGVAAYTAILASELARAGDEVHVWAPKPCRLEQGVVIHPLPDGFGLSSLGTLAKDLQQLPQDYRLLVQYVPHAFGWKAMNLPFCQWLANHGRSHHVWIMFHEVCFPKFPDEPLKHKFLRQANIVMARLLVSSAERVFVSIPFWGTLLNRLADLHTPPVNLPVPSNLPTNVEPKRVEAIQRDLAVEPGGKLFGYFGTSPTDVWKRLGPVFLELLNRNHRNKVLLLGSGGIDSRTKLLSTDNHLANRIVAPGQIPDNDAANHIAACDVLLYPFPDGVSGRRTSLLAALSLGMPIVTTAGQLTEPFWKESGAVAISDGFVIQELVDLAESLALDEQRQAELRINALSLYREVFDIGKTTSVLRS